VNPLFLCGNGLYFTELIKDKIYDMPRPNDSLLIVLNGVGGDELIMLTFANSLKEIAETVFLVRNLQFQDLKTRQIPKKSQQAEEWYNEVEQSSYAKEQCKEQAISEAHIFSTSYSLSGYAIELPDNLPEKLPDDGCQISFNWTIKPGHITNFTRTLDDCKRKLGINAPADRLYINDTMVTLTLTHHEIGKNGNCPFFDTLDELRSLDICKTDIRKLHISVSVVDDKHFIDIDGKTVHIIRHEEHPDTKRAFIQYAYDHETLASIRDHLDRSLISKVIKERIMKMYHNYNDCVQDPSFVVSFIGFKPFLDFLSKVIHSYVDRDISYSTDEVHEWLDSCARDFEQAYFNRFHQSNRMRTLSDFNLEWNGSIQQLIASMDYAYKLIMKCCNRTNYNKFMYVSGYERVHVTDHSYRINMQHLTYPELLASTVWKEQFNLLPDEATRDKEKFVTSLRMLKSDEFIDSLKKRICRHYRFNDANPTHRIFIKKLDREYMTSIIADSLAFHFGYNGNYKRFLYWYCRYLIQTPVIHNIDGTINDDRFIMFFSRLLFVFKLNESEIKSPTLEQLRLSPFDSSLESSWIASFEDLNTIVNVLLNTLQTYDFKRTINGMIIRLYELTYPLCAKSNNDTTLATQDINIKKFSFYNSIVQSRELSFKDFEAAFSENKIPITQCSEENMLIGNFFPSFLEYLQTLDNESCEINTSKSLPRDQNGKPELTPEYATCFSNILSDPLGGTFCINGITQRKYFAARSIFYMMLFHFYHQNITALIKA